MNGFWGDGGPYETWVGALRTWQRGEPVDLAALPALEREQFTADTWARLTRHILTAVDVRLKDWARRFQQAFDQAPDEFSAGRELTQAREGLRAIRALAGHAGLPPDIRTPVGELCDRHIRSVQEQLEHSLTVAARDGGDPDRLDQRLRTVRDNALTAVVVDPPPLPSARRARFTALRRSLGRERSGPGRREVRPAPGPPSAGPWATDADEGPRRRIMPD
ncbi:hypothetical protein [Streptomyces sp. NPDC057287]|uniref:hypothetical protein n=1 Tax=Streptomyces sp. NPDC057287 TaxID=3346086 RepID=UPI003628F7B9